MNKQQAWLQVADYFTVYAETGIGHMTQLPDGRAGTYTWRGLCLAVAILKEEGRISSETYRAMGDDIIAYRVEKELGTYFWPTTREFANLRADAAREMAQKT